MVAALHDAAQEDVPLVAQLVAQPLFRAAQGEVELREVLATDGAQLAAFPIRPDPFDRVEIRRITRKVLQMDAFGGSPSQEVLDGLATMDRGAIADDEKLAGDLAEEELEKADHICAVAGRILRLHHQAVVDRAGGDGRAMAER